MKIKFLLTFFLSIKILPSPKLIGLLFLFIGFAEASPALMPTEQDFRKFCWIIKTENQPASYCDVGPKHWMEAPRKSMDTFCEAYIKPATPPSKLIEFKKYCEEGAGATAKHHRSVKAEKCKQRRKQARQYIAMGVNVNMAEINRSCAEFEDRESLEEVSNKPDKGSQHKKSSCGGAVRYGDCTHGNSVRENIQPLNQTNDFYNETVIEDGYEPDVLEKIEQARERQYRSRQNLYSKLLPLADKLKHSMEVSIKSQLEWDEQKRLLKEASDDEFNIFNVSRLNPDGSEIPSYLSTVDVDWRELDFQQVEFPDLEASNQIYHDVEPDFSSQAVEMIYVNGGAAIVTVYCTATALSMADCIAAAANKKVAQAAIDAYSVANAIKGGKLSRIGVVLDLIGISKESTGNTAWKIASWFDESRMKEIISSSDNIKTGHVIRTRFGCYSVLDGYSGEYEKASCLL